MAECIGRSGQMRKLRCSYNNTVVICQQGTTRCPQGKAFCPVRNLPKWYCTPSAMPERSRIKRKTLEGDAVCPSRRGPRLATNGVQRARVIETAGDKRQEWQQPLQQSPRLCLWY
jgi:hypothetical protein